MPITPLSALNSFFPEIQFTMKEKKVQNIAFVNELIGYHNDGIFLTSVYWKLVFKDSSSLVYHHIVAFEIQNVPKHGFTGSSTLKSISHIVFGNNRYTSDAMESYSQHIRAEH